MRELAAAPSSVVVALNPPSPLLVRSQLSSNRQTKLFCETIRAWTVRWHPYRVFGCLFRSKYSWSVLQSSLVDSRRRFLQATSMQSQRCLRAPSSAPCVVLRPQARRPRCLVAQAAAVSVATAENEGDATWNKTYYPKLADTRKVEKDWCVSSSTSLSESHADHCTFSFVLWCWPT